MSFLKRSYVWLLLLIVITAFSPNEKAGVSYYINSDGLPGNTVYYAFQDSKGYMWFATDAGVARFNGKDFTVYSRNEGLSDDEVFQVREDRTGRIWFLTSNGSPSFYKNGKIHSAENTAWLSVIHCKDYLSMFYEDASGKIWLGAHTGELFVVSGDSAEAFSLDKITGTPNQGNLQRCLLMYEENEELKLLFTHGSILNLTRKTVEYELPGSPVITYAVKSGDELFFSVGTDVSAFNFRTSQMRAIQLPQSGSEKRNVTWLGIIQEKLWVGTWAGLYSNSIDENYVNKESVADGVSVSSVCIDQEGNSWITTLGNGLFYQRSSFAHVKQLISDCAVTCIERDQEGRVWIGGTNTLLGYYDHDVFYPQSTGFDRASRGQINVINHVAGGLTIAGGDPGTIFLKKDGSRLHSTSSLKCILEDEGVLWIGTSGNLYRVEQNRLGEFISAGPEKNELIVYDQRVNAIVQTANKSLLLATKTGVCALNPVTLEVDTSVFRDYVGKSVTELLMNGNTLWVGTNGDGVFINSDGQSRQITTSEGLAGNHCRSLSIVDSCTVLVSTNHGLSRIRFGNISDIEVANIRGSDGLSSEDVWASYRDPEGRVWVGTSTGLSLFETDPVPHEPVEVPLYIERVIVNGIAVSPQTSYGFQSGQNNLRFDFAALSYAHVKELRYRYRLTGTVSNENSTSNTYVEFPLLPPGDYTFSVEAQVNGKTVSNTPALVYFSIAAPLWRTGYFIAGIVLLIFLAFGLILYIRTRTIRTREELKRTALAAQQTALKAQMNPHFIFNSLNSIQHFIVQNEERNALNFLSKFSRLVQRVLSVSDLSLVRLTEEVEMLTHYIDLERLRSTDSFTFEVKIDADIDPHETRIPPMLIQPFVENAIWHGVAHLKQRGEIRISFYKEQGILFCSIEDNGIGREAAAKVERREQGSGVGILKTMERMKVINSLHGKSGHIMIIDKPAGNMSGGGVRVVIRFP